MYIKSIKLINHGPICNLQIDFPYKESGEPMPVVLLGRNGTGKTLFLASIVEALVELRGKLYTETPEVNQGGYLKLLSTSYISSGSDYSYGQIVLDTGAKLTELVTNLSADIFTEKYGDRGFDGFIPGDKRFREHKLFRQLEPAGTSKENLDESVLCFFPAARFDVPAWLNEENRVSFALSESRVDHTDRSLIHLNILDGIESWIVDLVADKYLFEAKWAPSVGPPKVLLNYEGPNTLMLNMLNEVLTKILQGRFPDLQYARIGVNPKSRRRVAIEAKLSSMEDEIRICPTLSHLSSGEAMLWGLSATLLREYDLATTALPTSLAEVAGVVIIDEVGLHLHISAQRNMLPELFRTFPRIQFIVSSHSPFFALGITEAYGEDCLLIELPSTRHIEPDQFVEFNEAYETFITQETRYRDVYRVIESTLGEMSRTKIITEGKTDWRHMTTALRRFRETDRYNDLDIEFLEYENDIEMGDSELAGMCRQFSKFPHSRKIVFVFDSDNPTIIKEMAGESGYRYWSNNVFSLCLPVPQDRKAYKCVSVEFLYTDEELKTADQETGKRLYFTNEVRINMTKSPTTKKITEAYLVLENPVASEEIQKKIFDKDAERIVDKEGQGLAHSKAVFADYVYKSRPGYDNLGIESFAELFDVLSKIEEVEDGPD